MGDVSIGLYGEEKIFWGLFVPVFESFLFWQLVKSVVDLYGVKILRIIFKPSAFWKLGRIKQLFPVVVMPS